MDRRQAHYLAATLGWMMMIFLLSHQPELPAPTWFPGQDKLAHFLVFGLLGYLFARAFRPEGPRSLADVALIAGFVLIYGITDELHQSYVPGRTPDAFDVIANTAGGLAISVWMTWRRRLPQVRQSA